MDWEQGVWLSKDNMERQREFRVTICSDWAPRTYEAMMLERPEAVYGDLLPQLRTADLALVNVECSLGDHGSPIPKGGPNLEGHEDTVGALTAVPFHVACLANNHVVDFGPEGLTHTLHTLKQAGLSTVGAGMDGEEAARPLRLDVRGAKVAIINCADGEECVSEGNEPGVYELDEHHVIQQIRELRQSGHLVIVIYHGGREHIPSPPPYVVHSLRAFAEQGASAVIAHHPHVPQGMEWIGQVPIFYSLGNFVFYQKNDVYFNHVGYMVHLDYASESLLRLEVVPYRIDLDGLKLLAGEEKNALFNDLKKMSDWLRRPDAIDQLWEALVDELGTWELAGALESYLRLLEEQPIKGASLLHNVLFTRAHRDLYLTAFKRVKEGRAGSSPQWARDAVRYWLDRSYSQSLES